MPQRAILGQPFLGKVFAIANNTFKSATIPNQSYPQLQNAFQSNEAALPAINSSIDCLIEVLAISGASASITVQLYGSNDGINFEAVGSATTALTAAGVTNLSNTNVDYLFLQVWVTESNTASPSATVNITVLGF